MLRTSERGTFKRCRYKWWQEFHEQIKPKRDVPPLRFGTMIHAALAAYYRPGIKRGQHPRPVFERLYARELKEAAKISRLSVQEIEADEVWEKHGELGVAMLDHYVDYYGKDDEWKVIVTEQPFKIIVPHPRDGVTPWFWYVGMIDGLWENLRTGRFVIPDHKTAVAIQTKYLSLDPQSTAYLTFGFPALVNARVIESGQKLDGLLFNFLRKQFPDERPKDAEGRSLNKDGSVSQKQPAPFFARVPIYRDEAERVFLRQQVLEEYADIEAVRRGAQGHYPNQGQFTCPGCWSFDICELREMGKDVTEFKEQTTKTWDPYASHEIREDR